MPENVQMRCPSLLGLSDFAAERRYKIAQGFYEAELVKGRCKKSILKADGLFGASAGQ